MFQITDTLKSVGDELGLDLSPEKTPRRTHMYSGMAKGWSDLLWVPLTRIFPMEQLNCLTGLYYKVSDDPSSRFSELANDRTGFDGPALVTFASYENASNTELRKKRQFYYNRNHGTDIELLTVKETFSLDGAFPYFDRHAALYSKIRLFLASQYGSCDNEKVIRRKLMKTIQVVQMLVPLLYDNYVEMNDCYDRAKARARILAEKLNILKE